MKKIIATFFSFFVLLSLTFQFAGCSSAQDYSQVITHIQAQEIEQAIDKCETLNDKVLEKAKEDILSAMIKNLTPYLSSSKYFCTKYKLVDNDTMNLFRKYESLVNILPLENTFTNVPTFINTVLSLESYIIWNNFYNAMSDDYGDNMLYWMQYANDCDTWSLAKKYYQKAYNEANSAYIHYNGQSGSGMKEITNYYFMYSKAIDAIINQTTYSLDSNIINKYSAALDDYGIVLNNCNDIVSALPSTLY